jgi:hypothetical protein
LNREPALLSYLHAADRDGRLALYVLDVAARRKAAPAPVKMTAASVTVAVDAVVGGQQIGHCTVAGQRFRCAGSFMVRVTAGPRCW